MGRVKHFEVLYDRSPARYKPGEKISGEVQITLSKGMITTGIYLKIYGQAYVMFPDNGSFTGFTADRENYINCNTCVYQDTESGELQQGQYSFKFFCVLPKNIPQSFQGRWGYITYKTLATIERKWKKSVVATRTFVVVGHLDLNNIRATHEPAHIESERYGMWGCTRQQITLRTRLNEKGCVGGQFLRILSECENMTEARQVSVALVQHVTYKSGGCTVTEQHKVCKVKGRALPEGQSRMCDDMLLTVPRYAPVTSTDGTCGIIAIQYTLNVKLKSRGLCQKDLRTSTPITIGSVPVKEKKTEGAPEGPGDFVPRRCPNCEINVLRKQVSGAEGQVPSTNAL